MLSNREIEILEEMFERVATVRGEKKEYFSLGLYLAERITKARPPLPPRFTERSQKSITFFKPRNQLKSSKSIFSLNQPI